MSNSRLLKPHKLLLDSILGSSTLVVLAYTTWIIGFHVQPEADMAISSGALVFLLILAVILSADIFLRKSNHPQIRQGWLFISLALLVKLIGESIGFYQFTFFGPMPINNISDYFTILYYPLFFVGILVFPFSPMKRRDYFLFLLDLAIVMVTLGMVFWYFILAPISTSTTPGMNRALSGAYPIGDLFLLAGLMVLIHRDVNKFTKTSLGFLALSMVLGSIPDAIFSYMENNDIRSPLSDLNVFWLASVLLLIYAAARQITSLQKDNNESAVIVENTPRLSRLIPTYLAAAIAPVLTIGIVEPTAICQPKFSVLLKGVVVLLVLVFSRQHIVLMDNFRLYQFNRKLAITDGLTKIYNRQFFNEIFQQEIKNASRYEKNLSVLLIDVDGFKSVNDTYGHLTGDKVLLTIAEVLGNQIRKSDILARYGGDEFVIILNETDLEGTMKVSQKINQAMEGQFVGDRKLSVSIGSAQYREDLSPAQLLEEADKKLYENKMSKSTARTS